MNPARAAVHDLTPDKVPPRDASGLVLPDRPATRADLEKPPRTFRGEIIHGSLHAFPRPRAPHQHMTDSIWGDLRDPFGRGRGGLGGWIFLTEPGNELAAWWEDIEPESDPEEEGSPVPPSAAG